jgi:hypothetical protein
LGLTFLQNFVGNGSWGVKKKVLFKHFRKNFLFSLGFDVAAFLKRELSKARRETQEPVLEEKKFKNLRVLTAS